jgi:hypothetical protein
MTFTIMAALICAAAGVLTACAAAPDTGSTNTRPSHSSPGEVALSYFSDVFSGQFKEASQWVDPKSRAPFELVFNDLSPSAVNDADLGVGSSTVTGDTALVIMTGKICTDGEGIAKSRPGSTPEPAPKLSYTCQSNRNPHSVNPVFRVKLVLTHGNVWFVSE